MMLMGIRRERYQITLASAVNRDDRFVLDDTLRDDSGAFLR